tara:strand:- start:430 stop:1017 length:588 start_codon:yes stop_codon:yes gene_type:complete
MQIKTIFQFFLIILTALISILFFYNYLGEESKIQESNYEKKFTTELKSTDKSINLLENLEYKTFDKDGNGYLLKAKYGETLIDRQNTLLLEGVNGEIKLKGKSTIYITSKYANYNKNNFDTNFFNNVVVVYEDSIAKSDNFDIFFSKNDATMYNNVYYTNSFLNSKADKIDVDLVSGDIDISMYDEKDKIEIIRK